MYCTRQNHIIIRFLHYEPENVSNRLITPATANSYVALENHICKKWFLRKIKRNCQIEPRNIWIHWRNVSIEKPEH